MSIAAILNPKSANGKTAHAWARLRQHFPGPVEVFETKAPGHAIELTAAAIRKGARTIIAVGGDGTINEVINGFFEGDQLTAANVTLGIVPHGTGSDFRRILKIPTDARQAAKVIQAGKSQAVDVARVAYTTVDGKPAVRYSINLTSFGMGGAVAARANRSSKAFGGQMSFLLATLATTLNYGGKRVTLRLDNSETIMATVTNVAIGNGQYHGGGMWVCPRASIDDGLLDVTVIRYLPIPELVRGLPMLYNGKIFDHPKVTFNRAKRVEAWSEDTTLIEIDGEPLGKLPIDVSIIPKAIRVLIP